MMIGRNSAMLSIRIARLSVGEKCCRSASTESTCAFVCVSNSPDTGSTTSTLADFVSHRSPAVEYGIHADRSSSVK